MPLPWGDAICIHTYENEYTYVQAMGREGENMDVGEYLLIHNNPSTHQMVKITPFDAYVSMSEVLSRWPL